MPTKDVSPQGGTARPVEPAMLAELEQKVLWLSRLDDPQRQPPPRERDGLKVGGHQASSASLVTIMTALYFAVLRPEDRVAVKPHASPVFHAIQYLLGNQTREKLEDFRGFGGAQSYPSRTKDTDDVDFSTGSVGLGAAVTVFASLVQDYLRAHGLGQQTGRAHGRARRRRRARRRQHLRRPARRLEARPPQLLVGDRLQPPEPRRGGPRGPLRADHRALRGDGLGGARPEVRHAARGGLRRAGRRAAARLDRPLPEPALFGAHLPGRRRLAEAPPRRDRRPGRGRRR